MKRLALLAVPAVLLAVALGGQADSAASETAKAPRLAAFGSCGQLLAYAKSNAGRLVGPYGLGSPLGRGGIADAARAAGPPKQGVDYSGTNVQEEGVDEPDLVKTNGNTALRSREREAERRRRERPEAASPRHARPRPGHEPRAAAPRRPAPRPLARRLLDRSAPGNGGADRALSAREVGARRGERGRSEAASARPHAHARRLVRGRAARRRQRADRHLGPGARRAALRAAQGRLQRGARRRDLSEPCRRRLVACLELAPDLPAQAGRREGGEGAPARPVPSCPPRRLLLRASAC